MCTACGGAQSEPRGWSYLKPHPGTPLPGTISAAYVLGNRPGKFGPPQGGGVPPVPPISLSHAMLALIVRQKRPRCNLNATLRILHLPPLSLPKVWSCPRCTPLIRLHQHHYKRVTWLARHTHCLPHIHPEANPAKEACEEIELPLYPLQLGRGDEAIVGIEIYRQVLY